MNKLITLFLIFIANLSYSQYYNIDPIIKDTISLSQFHYKVSGVANFTDSLVLKVELLDGDNSNNILLNGEYNFSDNLNFNLINFSYDKESNIFRFDLGNFTNGNLIIHMWVIDQGEIKNEIYYN